MNNALSIFLGMRSGGNLIIIVVVILLLFGGKKIPELMRGLGTGIKEFKDAAKGDDQSANNKKEDKQQE
jgi:sec-independent protein translocase protein TatA